MTLNCGFLCFIKIAKTIPGSPAPDPMSVHIFISFLSINSIVCALSSICLVFINFSDDFPIKFISLFLDIIDEL